MNYIIKYNLILDSSRLNEKIIKVKNKPNELFAKCSLEDYLKRKYNNFKALEIIDCNEDIASNIFNLFNSFDYGN